MPTIEPQEDKRKTFQALCESRALLWQLGDIENLQDAVDGCLPHALHLGLSDTDEVQLIMGRAFAAVRDDLRGWVP